MKVSKSVAAKPSKDEKSSMAANVKAVALNQKPKTVVSKAKAEHAPSGLRGITRAAQDGEIRRVDGYRVAPSQLLLVEANVRFPANPKLRAHIDDLKCLIKGYLENATNPKDRVATNGLSEIIQPIRVVVKNGKLHVVDGFCRTTAIHELVAEGYAIEMVDVIAQADSTPEGIVFTMLASANGLPLLPIEYAVAYTRLADELGISPAAITKQLNESGKRISLQRVEQLLLLGRAKPRIHELVLQDKIKADTAIVLIRKHRDDPDAAVRAVEEAIENAGGTVGRSTYSVPKKHQESIVKSIGDDRKRLQSVLASVKGDGSNEAWTERSVQVNLPAGVVEQLLKQLEKSA